MAEILSLQPREAVAPVGRVPADFIRREKTWLDGREAARWAAERDQPRRREV